MNELQTQAQVQLQKGLEVFLTTGNMGLLKQEQQAFVIAKTCEKYGLESIMRPFEIITFQGISRLYLSKNGCDQIANINELTRSIVSETYDERRQVMKVAAEVTNGKRKEIGIAFLSMTKFVLNPITKKGEKQELEGDEYCNAMMKVYSKAIRRATLAFVGVPSYEGEEEGSSFVAIPQVEDVKKIEVLTELKAPTPAPAPAPAPDPAPIIEEKKTRKKKEEKLEQAPPIIEEAVIENGDEEDEGMREIAVELIDMNIQSHKAFVLSLAEKFLPNWKEDDAKKKLIVKACLSTIGMPKDEDLLLSHLEKFIKGV